MSPFIWLLENCFFPNHFLYTWTLCPKIPNCLSYYAHVHTNEIKHSGMKLHFVYISGPVSTDALLKLITDFSIKIDCHM